MVNMLVNNARMKGHYAKSFTDSEKAYYYLQVNRSEFDYIVCDYNMPNYNGANLIRLAKSMNVTGNFIVLTGQWDKFNSDNKNLEDVIVYEKPYSLDKLIPFAYNNMYNSQEAA
jgi:DNA-binding NtrC family response regulator